MYWVFDIGLSIRKYIQLRSLVYIFESCTSNLLRIRTRLDTQRNLLQGGLPIPLDWEWQQAEIDMRTSKGVVDPMPTIQQFSNLTLGVLDTMVTIAYSMRNFSCPIFLLALRAMNVLPVPSAAGPAHDGGAEQNGNGQREAWWSTRWILGWYGVPNWHQCRIGK